VVKSREKYQCKSKQAEAMAGLMSAATAMEAAKVESGKYPETIDDLEKSGWTTEKKFYSYSIAASGPSSFIIEARGTGDMDGDVVRIDQEKKIEPITDKCK
jgi:Tfp pilus assembly protein PilE